MSHFPADGTATPHTAVMRDGCGILSTEMHRCVSQSIKVRRVAVRGFNQDFLPAFFFFDRFLEDCARADDKGMTSKVVEVAAGLQSNATGNKYQLT